MELLICVLVIALTFCFVALQFSMEENRAWRKYFEKEELNNWN